MYALEENKKNTIWGKVEGHNCIYLGIAIIYHLEEICLEKGVLYMKRFRKFIDKLVKLENVKDSASLENFSVNCTYLPDPPEEFDEFEFRTGFGGQDNIVIVITVELGKIKRMIITEADENNLDVTRSLSPERLEELLAQKGEQLVEFFKYITE